MPNLKNDPPPPPVTLSPYRAGAFAQLINVFLVSSVSHLDTIPRKIPRLKTTSTRLIKSVHYFFFTNELCNINQNSSIINKTKNYAAIILGHANSFLDSPYNNMTSFMNGPL